MTRLLLLVALGLLFLLPGIATTGQSPVGTAPPPYKDARLPAERRAEDLLARMTAEEKARMLAGSGWMESAPNERLGIPAIKMADGPMGVRNWAGSSAITNASSTAPIYATAFPAGVAMASTWDVELVQAEGRAIAHFTTGVFDLVPLDAEELRHEAPKSDPAYYFRPYKTILVRTVADGGESYYVQGDHGETVPTLYHLVLEQ